MHPDNKPNMVQMTLNRDFTLRTTKGHQLRFTKDVPVGVPSIIYREAVTIGAVRSDGAVAFEEDKKGPPPKTAIEMAELLEEAFSTLVKTGNREDFNGNGNPKLEAVNRVTGERYDARTANEGWKLYQAKQAGQG